MNTFSWLLIGHLVGDWLLQNDWMAANKQRHLFTKAGMSHFTIYTIALALALYIATRGNTQTITLPRYLLFSLIIFVSHWLIDATAFAKRWARLTSQSDLPMVNVMVDQTFHLLVIAALIQLL